ncbi:MAG TPA: DUF6364 family protein [Candidatus Deferrimicrobiaceae bacterium]|jgi:hypothetical protein
MQTKLTLSLDEEVIAKAKLFSRRRRKSLSKLVEGYLREITTQPSGSSDIAPPVAALIGVISSKGAASGPKGGYAEFLSDKYR